MYKKELLVYYKTKIINAALCNILFDFYCLKRIRIHELFLFIILTIIIENGIICFFQ